MFQKIVSTNVKGIKNRIFHSQTSALVMQEKFWISVDPEKFAVNGDDL